MDEPYPPPPKGPEPFYWFLASLVIGWAIPAYLEGHGMSTGTLFGALFGSIIGLWLGTVRWLKWKSKIKLPPPTNSDAP